MWFHRTENVCTDLCRDLLPPFLTTYPANKSSPIQLPIHSSIFTKILIFRHPLLSPLPISLFLPPPLQHPIQLALSLPYTNSRSIFPSIHLALPRSRHYFPPFGVCVSIDTSVSLSCCPTHPSHQPSSIMSLATSQSGTCAHGNHAALLADLPHSKTVVSSRIPPQSHPSIYSSLPCPSSSRDFLGPLPPLVFAASSHCPFRASTFSFQSQSQSSPEKRWVPHRPLIFVANHPPSTYPTSAPVTNNSSKSRCHLRLRPLSVLRRTPHSSLFCQKTRPFEHNNPFLINSGLPKLHLCSATFREVPLLPCPRSSLQTTRIDPHISNSQSRGHFEFDVHYYGLHHPPSCLQKPQTRHMHQKRNYRHGFTFLCHVKASFFAPSRVSTFSQCLGQPHDHKVYSG